MRFTVILINLILSYSLYAQDTSIVKIINDSTYINTINGNSIFIILDIDFSNENLKGFEIDTDSFYDLNTALNPNLISKKYPNLLNQGEKIILGAAKKSINFKISNLTDELIHLMQDGVAHIYVKTDKDIIFKVFKTDDTTTEMTLKISKIQIEKQTRSKPFLTKSMAKELINAKGGEIFLTQNKIDFGMIPSDQASSGKNEYNASFKYRTRYSFLSEIPIFLYTEGLISSNSKDSLNFISIYPVNYNFFKGTNELVGQLGIEGNQVFTNYRISGNFYWNGLIPNLIDLTLGENRLRLKPVVKLGFKLYKEIENNRPVRLNNNEFSNQIYSEMYYYIPLQSLYSIIIEGSAFYDFSSIANTDKQVMYNYSITLGVDFPKTDFKTIFKFSKGDNVVSKQSNEFLMIGLMVDLFEIN